MNKEDIIRMAIDAGWDAHHAEFDTRIQTFAALVASAEREACAKRLDAVGCDHCATNIRARGQA
jgi:hypothetical protein